MQTSLGNDDGVVLRLASPFHLTVEKPREYEDHYDYGDCEVLRVIKVPEGISAMEFYMAESDRLRKIA